MDKKEFHDLQIDLTEEIAQGKYSNMAIISHSSSEFILDFITLLPGLKKTNVQSRVIMAPEHVKRLLYAIQDNIVTYEKTFGEIRMPRNIQKDEDKDTFVPPIGDFKVEA